MLELFVSNKFVPNNLKEDALNVLKPTYNNTAGNIPKIVHLIYLNQRPLHSYNYQCINSIIKHMPEYTIYIHNDIEPETDEWNLLKQNSNVKIIKTERIRTYDDFPIIYVQYEADILRLQILYKYGGIYMDTDIFLVKNIDSLLDGSNIYYSSEKGNFLINSVIISEPNNGLLRIFLDNIGAGIRMNVWAWHIKNLPKILLDNNPYYKYKYGLRILEYEVFCPIHWSEPELFNDSNYILPEKTYGIHLYETILGNALENSTLFK